MSFFAPAAAGLVALGALIVVQYFLKLRRPLRPIPSTFLWERALADTRANAPWQRLRPDPLLLLQLLALAALVLALMRPYVLRAGAPNENQVLVLDASLTTQATDGGTARFAAERARAQSLVDDLSPGNTMSVIRMDSHPRVLIASSSDHSALHAALDGQQPGFDQPDARTALSLATGLAGQYQGTTSHALVHILRSANTSLPALDTRFLVQDQAFGNTGAPNLDIAAFAAASQANGTSTAVLRIINSGAANLTSDVEIRADGRLQDVQTVTVAPGDQAVVTSANLPGNARVFRAHLTAADAIAADNTAWAVLNPGTQSHVLLVTNGDLFLRSALAGSPNVALSEVTPARYSAADARGADLVVFDAYVPPSLPATNLLLISPPGPVLDASATGTRTAGAAHTGDDPAGLLRYMTPSNVHIARTRVLLQPSWAHIALRDNTGPLLLEGQPALSGGTGSRVAILGFDIHDSDLPLSLDFPVFVANLLDWLAPGVSLDQASYHPGDIVHIGIPAGAGSTVVQSPDGSRHTLSNGAAGAPGVVPFADTGTPGVYTLEERIGATHLAVAFPVNTAIVAPIAAGGAGDVVHSNVPSAVPTTKIPVELTGAVAAIVLVVLAGEWYIAMRRR